MATPKALASERCLHDAIAGWASVDRHPPNCDLTINSRLNTCLKCTNPIQVGADQQQRFCICLGFVLCQEPFTNIRVIGMPGFFPKHSQPLRAALQRCHQVKLEA